MSASKKGQSAKEVVKRAFGEANRYRLLNTWFQDKPHVSEESAWAHVYRLLLWIDRSTGLAHCYESDKSQPGRHWYLRSLAFHAWVSEQFEVSPNELGTEIDWLFKRAINDLTVSVEQGRERLLAVAETQRAQFKGDFPQPGDDSELFALITQALQPYLTSEVPDAVLRLLSQRITAHLGQENKRKNLIGEGFEDVLASLIERIPELSAYHANRRALLHSLPGFYPPRGNDKVKRVDLGLINTETGRRHLVTAKWSIRADREEQLATDFVEFERLESAGQDFDYVLLTNEFDPARLAAACHRRSGNKAVFTHVVHVNPEALIEAYGSSPMRSAAEVVELVKARRLTSLSAWLRSLRSTV